MQYNSRICGIYKPYTGYRHTTPCRYSELHLSANNSIQSHAEPYRQAYKGIRQGTQASHMHIYHIYSLHYHHTPRPYRRPPDGSGPGRTPGGPSLPSRTPPFLPPSKSAAETRPFKFSPENKKGSLSPLPYYPQNKKGRYMCAT